MHERASSCEHIQRFWSSYDISPSPWSPHTVRLQFFWGIGRNCGSCPSPAAEGKTSKPLCVPTGNAELFQVCRLHSYCEKKPQHQTGWQEKLCFTSRPRSHYTSGSRVRTLNQVSKLYKQCFHAMSWKIYHFSSITWIHISNFPQCSYIYILLKFSVNIGIWSSPAAAVLRQMLSADMFTHVF